MLYNSNVDLVNENVLLKFSPFFHKILRKTEFWRQSREVTMMQIFEEKKKILYVDFVNVNMYTEFKHKILREKQQ